MYKVSNAHKVSEIVKEVSEQEDKEIFLEHNGIVATALIVMKDEDIKPVVRYIPKSDDLYGVIINSYVNVSNMDYKGKMEIQIYLGSTDSRERARLCKCKKLPTFGNLLDVFNKCPKLRHGAKYTLVFSQKAKKLDMNKVNELFPAERFNILVE